MREYDRFLASVASQAARYEATILQSAASGLQPIHPKFPAIAAALWAVGKPQHGAFLSLRRHLVSKRRRLVPMAELPEAMEARSVSAIPRGDCWQYEPKWDGFRCLLQRHGDAVTMLSKSGQDLKRYFPEVEAATLALPEKHFMLDGELVVPTEETFSFDNLLQRIHPAPTRIRRLSAETPALFLAFDLLCRGKRDLTRAPLAERRPALEDFADHVFGKWGLFRLSPATTDAERAAQWLRQAGGGSDGVIAKRIDLVYQGGNREGMQKIKRHRSADCVIGGFRYGQKLVDGRKVAGSVLLGLYDSAGLLQHVGFSSGIKTTDKLELTNRLEAMTAASSFTGSKPGGPSRWASARSSEWQPVKPKLVVEVSYDHFTGARFRHGTSILRWRPDKKPRQCTMEQLEQQAIAPTLLLAGDA
jgi:ATP-dependent DNA ligase